jgi:hypothetical protein
MARIGKLSRKDKRRTADNGSAGKPGKGAFNGSSLSEHDDLSMDRSHRGLPL